MFIQKCLKPLTPRSPFTWAFLLAILVVGCTQLADLATPPKLSPFTEVKYVEEEVHVKYEGTMYRLVSLDGHSTKKLIEFTKRTYESRWQKRFSEDLVQVLWKMKHRPGDTVKLELVDLKSKMAVKIAGAKMTSNNRALVWQSRQDSEPNSRTLSTKLDKAGQLKCITEFEAALKTRWSYYKANDANFVNELKKLRKHAEEGMDASEFALSLRRILALGIDGHASVSGRGSHPGFLPFVIEPVGNRYVAFLADRKAFADPARPYITKIDGRSINDWCVITSELVAQGSPQYVTRNALRSLRSIQYWRAQAVQKPSDTISVELTSADGKNTQVVKMPVAQRSPSYGIWPRKQSGLLKEKIGYLRITQMSRSAVRDIQKWMPQFREMDGLIVDVRDNGGGSREALRLLFSFLMKDGDQPRVVNAAKYRKHVDFGQDHLGGSRFMYRAKDDHWNAAEQEAVAGFRKTFKPEWQPPAKEFSDWHYLVLNRLDDPSVYFFDKPVVVLMNAKCFSATDIFLAGLKGWRDVTLMGTASGGGSARTTSVRLTGGISLRIGSMASFQTDGKLFDGNGVKPDVLVDPKPTYFIGGEDTQLKAAIARIKQLAP
jgi:hypothetical protein